MADLTIIIPSYNHAAFLERTLHTLTLQTQKDFRVILVDHGSTDDTRMLVESYQHRLVLDYYWVPRNDYFSPAFPRDTGVRYARSPLIAFLDAGMMVPSFYVAAHLAFHKRARSSVGIGWQYGASDGEASERLTALLEQKKGIDDLEPHLIEDTEWCDKRRGRNLTDMAFPWTLAWGANLSFSTEAYWEAGGSDLDLKGWGFEDLDLCYRLYKHGLDMAFVEDGWGIEAPHPRTVVKGRKETEYANIQSCYYKQRSLALECLLFSIERWKGAEEVFIYLTALGQSNSALPALAKETWLQFAHPSLLIGGTEQDTAHFDYIALTDEHIVSTPSLWSCSGIAIPMPDCSLETVVIADMWRKLGWSHSLTTYTLDTSLLASLVKEIRRTAKVAYFINTPLPSMSSEQSNVTVAELENLCHLYDLPFQLIAA